MYNISLDRIDEIQRGASALRAEIERAAQAIERRAFDHFQRRGGIPGRDLDDWLNAERELAWSPGAELTAGDKEITLRVQAPGLEPDHIRLTATPDSILIQAEVLHRHGEPGERLCFCEFAENMFRRFTLPHGIDVDKVTAILEKGILTIVAAKAQAETSDRTPPFQPGTAAE